MTTVHGKPACSCLAAWIPVFEDLIGEELHWFQLVGDAPASEGFHKGGGSGDTRLLTDRELRIARNMGAAAFNRNWPGNKHAHLRLNGCPHNSVAQPQVDDLNEGRDGTGPLWDNAGAPDNGPRDGVKFPLRTWREGIKWAEARLEDEIMANIGEQILTELRGIRKELREANRAAKRAEHFSHHGRDLILAEAKIRRASDRKDQAEHDQSQAKLDELLAKTDPVDDDPEA